MLITQTLRYSVGIYLDSKNVSKDVHKDVVRAIQTLKDTNGFPDFDHGPCKLKDLQDEQRKLILGLGAYIVGIKASEQKKLTAACDLIHIVRSDGNFEALRLTLGYS